MKKLLLSTIVCLFIFSCSNQENSLNLIDNQQINQLSSDLDSKYIVTARAIIDAMPNSNPKDYHKYVSDFERELKTLNRYAITGLIKYNVDVIFKTLKPNQNFMDHPNVKLLYPAMSRLSDIQAKMLKSAASIVYIAKEKDINKQEFMIKEFTSDINKLAKVDLKTLIDMIKNNKLLDPSELPSDSPLAKRLINILERKLNSI
ncbi:MAG: hypothetical protein KatS3mg068_0840 [Candidatus Sericytochromatia bacterium]|nr:MAG: hypothetical protein KatS3mg068_0840 [Candidatus Sericytochromatia bacterium]